MLKLTAGKTAKLDMHSLIQTLEHKKRASYEFRGNVAISYYTDIYMTNFKFAPLLWCGFCNTKIARISRISKSSNARTHTQTTVRNSYI